MRSGLIEMAGRQHRPPVFIDFAILCEIIGPRDRHEGQNRRLIPDTLDRVQVQNRRYSHDHKGFCSVKAKSGNLRRLWVVSGTLNKLRHLFDPADSCGSLERCDVRLFECLWYSHFCGGMRSRI